MHTFCFVVIAFSHDKAVILDRCWIYTATFRFSLGGYMDIEQWSSLM